MTSLHRPWLSENEGRQAGTETDRLFILRIENQMKSFRNEVTRESVASATSPPTVSSSSSFFFLSFFLPSSFSSSSSSSCSSSSFFFFILLLLLLHFFFFFYSSSSTSSSSSLSQYKLYSHSLSDSYILLIRLFYAFIRLSISVTVSSKTAKCSYINVNITIA